MALSLIGRLLHRVRTGDRRSVWNLAPLAAPESIRLTSPAFSDGGPLPARYAGAGVGDNVSPPLAWTGLPPGTRQLVLVIEDIDVPFPRPLLHTIAVLPGPRLRVGGVGEGGVGEGGVGAGGVGVGGVGVGGLGEGGVSEGGLARGAPDVAFVRASLGRRGYAGPRPVPGHGDHRYRFLLFALDTPLARPGAAPPATVRRAIAAMRGHVIARGRITGTFRRG